MPSFCQATSVYYLGELSNNDPDYAYPYQDVLNGGGIIDYPIYFAFDQTSVYSRSATMVDLAYNISVDRTNRVNSMLYDTFTENHDNPRIAWHNPDLSVAANAIGWPILVDDIPITYQGQWQHLAGADDPSCKEAIRLEENGSYNTSTPLHGTTVYINRIWNWAISQSDTFTTTKNIVLNYSDNQISMRKDVVRTILTFSEFGQAGRSYTTDGAGFDSGEVVLDLINCRT